MEWDWDWIWKAVLIVLGGTALLRFAGRKSISQMTLATSQESAEVARNSHKEDVPPKHLQ